MAQTGFTPILIYASGTTTNTPSAGNLTNSANGAELAINYYDGKLFYKDASNVVQVLATKGSAVVGGSNTQVQYNSSGALAGSSSFVFDGTNVGIGTSSPAKKLDITGTYRSQIDPSNSSFFGATLTLAGDNGTNQSGARIVGGYEGGFGLLFQTSTGGQAGLTSDPSLLTYTTKMQLNSSGNLGLGVTPSTSSVRTFEIGAVGNGLVNGGTADTYFVAGGYYNAGWKYALTGTAVASYEVGAGNGSHVWKIAGSGTAGNALTWTSAMTLDANGYLLVGGTSSVYASANRTAVEVNGTSQSMFANNIGGTNGGYLYHDGTNYTLNNVKNAALIFSTNNAEKMRIDSSGNVGIGTSSPSSYGKLAVYGSSGDIISVGQTLGTTSQTAWWARNDSGTQVGVVQYGSAKTAYGALGTGEGALYSNSNLVLMADTASGVMKFATGGNAEKMRLDSSGNLGLGVTPSAWTYKALQIGNTSYSATSATGTTAYITANGYFNGTNWIYQANDNAARYAVGYGTGTHAWFTAGTSAGTAGNAISFTQAMTLDASGNLSLGATSQSAYRKLTIKNDGSNGGIALQNSSGTTVGAFCLENVSTSTEVGIYSTGDMHFYTNNTERMRIDSSGNVGIGNTPSGTYKLQVSGLISDTAGNVRAIPQNAQTSAYVLVVGDVGKHISITTGGVTCNASIFSAGDAVTIYNNSGSNQTITAGASVTFRLAGTATTGNRTLAQYGVATLLCVTGGATPTFVVSGAGVS